MHHSSKEWLVRTRSGEVLGPFSQRELIEELQKKSFSADDEIAPSYGQWISAQSLLHHDIDEFTRTSTKSHITRSIHTSAQSANNSSSSAAQKLSFNELENEDLTPTPDFVRRPNPEPPIQKSPTKTTESSASRLGPAITGFLVLITLWIIVSNLKQPKKETKGTGALTGNSPAQIEGESAFSREVYDLIARGQNKEALKRLQTYHQKKSGSSEVDYLIPYSILLITEGVSTAQARKFLEQVINLNVSPQLKARAHLWLGYLMLSEGEGDMGENHFLESLQLNPRDTAARFNLGRAYLKQQKFLHALDFLSLAEESMPNLWLIHLHKGRAKMELGQNEEARNSFKAAIAAAPDRWTSYMYYALFLNDTLRDVETAQKTLKFMLTRDPHYEVHSPAPLGFYQESRNYAEYLNAFLKVMDRSSGEEKEVGKVFLSYLINGPGSQEAQRLEAAANRGGITSKVIAMQVLLDRDCTPVEIQNALNHLPANLNEFGYYAYVLRGEAQMRLGRMAEAQADFQRAIALEPNAAVARWGLVTLLKKTQRKSEADGELKTLLSYHPNYFPAIVQPQ